MSILVPSPDQIVGLARSGLGLLKELRGLGFHRQHDLKWASRKRLIFVEQPSYWISGHGPMKEPIVTCVANFTITNPNDHDGNLLVARVQVRPVGLLTRGTWEDGFPVYIGDVVLFPSEVGILVTGRTSVALSITHRFTADALPPDETKLAVEIRLIDQFKRRHFASIKVKPYPKPPAPR